MKPKDIILNGVIIVTCLVFASIIGQKMKPKEVEAKEYTMDDLLSAIEQVESNGNADAVGDNGQAIGSFQIHKIYVDDVNRIKGNDIFTYKDRWNKHLSREMTKIYLTHYGKGKTIEQIAALHVAGPDGWKQLETSKAVQNYVHKVMRELKRR